MASAPSQESPRSPVFSLQGAGEGKVRFSSLFLLLLCGLTSISLEHSVRQHRQTTVADRIIYSDPSNLPVVVADPIAYPTIWWYAPASMKDRIVYLGDAPASNRI